jgi:dihydroorotate dehydrogenase (fumarate)
MLCSILLRCGIDQIRVIEREMVEWLEAHEYDSVEELKGSMSQQNCPDPAAFERAQYIRGLFHLLAYDHRRLGVRSI